MTTIRQTFLFLACLATFATMDSMVQAIEPDAKVPRGATLHLTNGSYVRGSLADSDTPEFWCLQSDHFMQPFRFQRSRISAVHYELPGNLPKATGDYCFELAAGDVLFGALVGFTDAELEVENRSFGRLHIRRDHVRRFYRLSGQDLIYLGPLGLAGWKEADDKKKWRDEGGHPTSDQVESSIFGDFGIPAQAVVEFELSWKTKADFIFALGCDSTDASFQRAFCFEVWFKDVIVQREAEREADLEALRDIQAGAGRLHVQAYLDQKLGRIMVYSPEGASLADLTVLPGNPRVHSGIRLTNKSGDVRLERLRISRWNGVPPLAVQADKSRLHRTDGSILYGHLLGYDAVAKEFTIREEKGETRVPEQQVASVFLSPPSESPVRVARSALLDGTQVSGEPVRVAKDSVTMNCPGIKEPLQVPIAELRSLVVVKRDESRSTDPGDRDMGTLELDGLRLRGNLVDGREQPDSSCLVWQPQYSESASPLRRNVSGRVVYRDLPPAMKQADPQPRVPVAAVQARAIRVGGIGGGSPSPYAAAAATTKQTRSLHLRSGDTIPCEVTSINEEGVTFRSTSSDTTFVKHEKIKAVELIAVSTPPKLAKSKRERVLTLPRSQKNSPPTHLLFSQSGDVLRGRVMDMNEKDLRVEVHLETKVVPRSRIARIIWLHPDELEGAAPAPNPPAKDSAAATRVQVVRNDGIRFTFLAEQVAGKTLTGKSEVLGACRAEIPEIDQLLIGNAIEASAADLVYQQWKLQHAIEPRFVQETAGDAGSERLPGIDSELVGKIAPDFELDLLDGKSLHLADHRGHIVVLDFWATWCGPCLQAMPQIEQVIKEFKDRDVRLFAVNLEESAQQIKGTLERHKLSVPVALDRDGVVAAKYQALAIPQTVVIDREGKIAYLFVGGGPKFPGQLRDSLEKLLADQPPAATSTSTPAQ